MTSTSSAHELALLTEGLRALDRSDQARALLDQEGLTVAGRYGTQAHPMLIVERDSRLAAVRILRELGLDPNAIKDARPPRIASRYDD